MPHHLVRHFKFLLFSFSLFLALESPVDDSLESINHADFLLGRHDEFSVVIATDEL